MKRGVVVAFVSVSASVMACTSLLDLGTARFDAKPDAATTIDDASTEGATDAAGDASSSAPASFLVWAGGGVPNASVEDDPTAEVLIARVRDDGTLDEWKRGPDLPQARYRQSVVGIDGHVFVIGGGDTPQTAQGTSVYDIAIAKDGSATVATSDVTLPPMGIADGCSVAANGKIYAKSYSGDAVLIASVENGKLGGWKTFSPLSSDELLSGSIVATPGALFAPSTVSGTKNVKSLALGTSFEPAASAWMPVTPVPRNVAANGTGTPLVTDGTRLFAVGTFSDANEIETRVFAATISTGALAWEELDPFSTRRRNHSAVVASGHLYVVGGIDEGGGLVDVTHAPIRSDGKLGTWAKTTALPSPRDGRCALAAVTVQ